MACVHDGGAALLALAQTSRLFAAIHAWCSHAKPPVSPRLQLLTNWGLPPFRTQAWNRDPLTSQKNKTCVRNALEVGVPVRVVLAGHQAPCCCSPLLHPLPTCRLRASSHTRTLNDPPALVIHHHAPPRTHSTLLLQYVRACSLLELDKATGVDEDSQTAFWRLPLLLLHCEHDRWVSPGAGCCSTLP